MKFRKGEILFREKDAGDFFYIIQEGQVEVFKTRLEKRIPIAILRSGECVGELTALDGKARSATAVALTPVVAIKITAKALEAQILANPSWFRTITFGLVDRLRQTNEVLKRNAIVDSQLLQAIRAAQQNGKGGDDDAGEDGEGGQEAA